MKIARDTVTHQVKPATEAGSAHSYQGAWDRSWRARPVANQTTPQASPATIGATTMIAATARVPTVSSPGNPRR